jgi:cupin superfamily acireductone dioxygenase involved in methionine salvage
MDLDDIRKNIPQVSDRCIEIQYEDLIAQPSTCLGKIQDFCGLGSDEEFEARIKAMRFYDVRDKWKKYLSEKEGDLVLEFFRRTEND